MHLTCGILWRFQAFFWLRVCLAPKAECTPAHTQVTHTVRVAGPTVSLPGNTFRTGTVRAHVLASCKDSIGWRDARDQSSPVFGDGGLEARGADCLKFIPAGLSRLESDPAVSERSQRQVPESPSLDCLLFGKACAAVPGRIEIWFYDAGGSCSNI